jgi:RNA polymerase sigma factor (sigma-70 family)
MIDQATRTFVPTNRCKDAFSKKSNPNGPRATGDPQDSVPSDGQDQYPKRCDPRPVRPPLTAEQKELVERYLPLAYSLAKKRNIRRMRVGAPDEIHEMRSAATMALVDAAGKFDPTLGVNFAVFSRRRIEGSLSDFERLVLWYNWQGKIDSRPKFRKLSLGVERRGRVLYMQEDPPVGTQFDAIEEVEVRLRPLPPLQAAVCRLIYLEGKSQDEAAKALGYSKSYFSRVHQAALSQISIGA